MTLARSKLNGEIKIDAEDRYHAILAPNPANATYDEAQNWLLEDEYEPVAGRLSAVD